MRLKIQRQWWGGGHRTVTIPSSLIVFSLKGANKIDRSNTKPGLLICSSCGQWWLYGIMQPIYFMCDHCVCCANKLWIVIMCISLWLQKILSLKQSTLFDKAAQSCSRFDSCWYLSTIPSHSISHIATMWTTHPQPHWSVTTPRAARQIRIRMRSSYSKPCRVHWETLPRDIETVPETPRLASRAICWVDNFLEISIGKSW